MYNTPSICTENISHSKLFIDLIRVRAFSRLAEFLPVYFSGHKTGFGCRDVKISVQCAKTNCTAKGKSMGLVLASRANLFRLAKNMDAKFSGIVT